MSRHLVTVWNPLYAREVEQHLSVLLDWSRRAADIKANADDIYVWWGKMKSPNRQQPLRRTPDIQALAKELDEEGEETHLYVTDYRSLYVGDLADIHEGDLPTAERDHVPPYYADQELTCDFWFMLGDMRRRREGRDLVDR